MENYKGEVIEESLENKEVLQRVKILSTRVEEVTEKHKTSWLNQWTLHLVEVPVDQADKIAQEVSQSFDKSHGHSWYVDFKNISYHYIVYPNKVFFIDRRKKEQYYEAEKYGVSIGIPQYQLVTSSGNYYED